MINFEYLGERKYSFDFPKVFTLDAIKGMNSHAFDNYILAKQSTIRYSFHDYHWLKLWCETKYTENFRNVHEAELSIMRATHLVAHFQHIQLIYETIRPTST